MRRSWSLRLLLLAAVFVSFGLVGCSSNRAHHDPHANVHEYRHGYYNPTDGYFHDEHWHYTGPYSKHYYGPYPGKARSVSYWHKGPHPHAHRDRAVNYGYY